MNDNTNKAYYKAKVKQLKRALAEAEARANEATKQLAAMVKIAGYWRSKVEHREQAAELQSIFADEARFNSRILAKLNAIENALNR